MLPNSAVESNYKSIDVCGLSGTGTFEFNVPVTTAFQLSGGGVLGVIARESGENGQVWTSKTNSLNCSEAEGSASPTPTASPTAPRHPTPTASPTPSQTSSETASPTPSPTPEGSVAGGRARRRPNSRFRAAPERRRRASPTLPWVSAARLARSRPRPSV